MPQGPPEVRGTQWTRIAVGVVACALVWFLWRMDRRLVSLEQAMAARRPTAVVAAEPGPVPSAVLPTSKRPAPDPVWGAGSAEPLGVPKLDPPLVRKPDEPKVPLEPDLPALAREAYDGLKGWSGEDAPALMAVERLQAEWDALGPEVKGLEVPESHRTDAEAIIRAWLMNQHKAQAMPEADRATFLAGCRTELLRGLRFLACVIDRHGAPVPVPAEPAR